MSLLECRQSRGLHTSARAPPRGAKLAEHALEDRCRQAIPTVGEGFEGQRGLIASQAGMETPRVTGVDGVAKAGSSRGARDKQPTDDRCDNEERRDEAEEKHEEPTMMLPATSRPLTTLPARGTDTRVSGRPLDTRRTANSRGLISLRRHRQCRRGHAPLARHLLPHRIHDAHRRAMPVVMDGNAGMLIGLKGHPILVQMGVLTRGRRAFHNGRSTHGDGVARNYIALRRRGSFLRRARVFRLTRRN